MRKLYWLGILVLVSIFCFGGVACKSDSESESELAEIKKAEASQDVAHQVAKADLTLMEELGKKLFFDTNLSDPPGQGCVSCHSPEVGFTGPDSEINLLGGIYEGAVEGRFGNRKPPSAAYAGDSPVFHQNEEGTFVGGMFWDGRASGFSLGDPLAEQAMGPFLNPLEQNNPDKQSVIFKVKESDYAQLFVEVWGEGSLDAENNIEDTYEKIARAISAYERSDEVNPFSSKFDDFWRKAKATGLDVDAIDESNWQKYMNLGLEEDEVQGMMLFKTKGLCAECHPLASVSEKPPLFTDFTYDNLGVPKNPDNPFYKLEKKWNPLGADWLDLGLGVFLRTTKDFSEQADEGMGLQKVPTLRNVDLRPSEDFAKAFTHNGFFRTLKDVVHFYNTRDRADAEWPPPEVADNVNVDELGDLGLTDEEEDLIVKFMKTLSDK